MQVDQRRGQMQQKNQSARSSRALSPPERNGGRMSPGSPGTPQSRSIASPEAEPFQPQPRRLIPFSSQRDSWSHEASNNGDLSDLWGTGDCKDSSLDHEPRPWSAVSTSAGPTPSPDMGEFRASTSTPQTTMATPGPKTPPGSPGWSQSQSAIVESSKAVDEPATVRKVFVGGIPQEMNQTDLHNFFNTYVPVKKAWLQKYRPPQAAQGSSSTHSHRGFGFVIFYDDESVDKLLGSSYSRFFQLQDGRKLEVKRAVSSNDIMKAPSPPPQGSSQQRQQQQQPPQQQHKQLQNQASLQNKQRSQMQQKMFQQQQMQQQQQQMQQQQSQQQRAPQQGQPQQHPLQQQPQQQQQQQQTMHQQQQHQQPAHQGSYAVAPQVQPWNSQAGVAAFPWAMPQGRQPVMYGHPQVPNQSVLPAFPIVAGPQPQQQQHSLAAQPPAGQMPTGWIMMPAAEASKMQGTGMMMGGMPTSSDPAAMPPMMPWPTQPLAMQAASMGNAQWMTDSRRGSNSSMIHMTSVASTGEDSKTLEMRLKEAMPACYED